MARVGSSPRMHSGHLAAHVATPRRGAGFVRGLRGEVDVFGGAGPTAAATGATPPRGHRPAGFARSHNRRACSQPAPAAELTAVAEPATRHSPLPAVGTDSDWDSFNLARDSRRAHEWLSSRGHKRVADGILRAFQRAGIDPSEWSARALLHLPP